MIPRAQSSMLFKNARINIVYCIVYCATKHNNTRLMDTSRPISKPYVPPQRELERMSKID